jgi:hypothetical protein
MSLVEIVAALGPFLLKEFESLGTLIASSSSPSEAIAKAKRNLEIDALVAATDATLDAALKASHKK